MTASGNETRGGCERRTMTSDEKNRCDVMLKLYELSFLSFDKRRTYEWKFSLTIWAAIVSLATVTLKFNLQKNFGPTTGVICSFAAVVIILAQLWFLIQLQLGNNCDRYRAFFYEKQINDVLGVHFENAEKTQEDVSNILKKVKDSKWRARGWWSVVFHLIITGTLLIITGILIYVATQG